MLRKCARKDPPTWLFCIDRATHIVIKLEKSAISNFRRERFGAVIEALVGRELEVEHQCLNAWKLGDWHDWHQLNLTKSFVAKKVLNQKRGKIKHVTGQQVIESEAIIPAQLQLLVHNMKMIFIMESLCLNAKRDFLPEFSICIFISSSVAKWYRETERCL